MENMQTCVNFEDLFAHLQEVRDQWDGAITWSNKISNKFKNFNSVLLIIIFKLQFQ